MRCSLQKVGQPFEISRKLLVCLPFGLCHRLNHVKRHKLVYQDTDSNRYPRPAYPRRVNCIQRCTPHKSNFPHNLRWNCNRFRIVPFESYLTMDCRRVFVLGYSSLFRKFLLLSSRVLVRCHRVGSIRVIPRI